MSIMPTGHPDFQGYSSWRSANQFPQFNTAFPPGNTPGQVAPVFNFAAVMLRIVPSSGFGKVTVSWFLDQAATLGVAADSWPVTAATGLFVVQPAEASFVRVDMNNTSGVTLNAQTYLAGINAAVNRPSYPITDDIAGGFNIAIPANGFQKFYRGWINKGSGKLHLRPGDAAGMLNYQVVTEDQSGAAQAELAIANGITTVTDLTFPWPDTIVSLHVTNIDAANPHSFNYGMWSADA